MHCENCRADEIAYTLRAHVDVDRGEPVDLHFCSADCLDVWT
jgi:hypothetical protein